jgi:hypothetical protein
MLLDPAKPKHLIFLRRLDEMPKSPFEFSGRLLAD